MASLRSSPDNGAREGAVGGAFQLVAQGLAQLQEALRLQKQEAERKVQEALRLQKQEAERKVQEALRLQKQEAERRMQEALRLQEQRAATALREMERKLQEKDDAIRALQQRLQETQERVRAIEERTTVPEGSGGGGGGLQRLEGRVEKVEASLQSAVQKFLPRVEVLLRQLENPRSPRASLATAASAREAPASGGAAAVGGEEPPSSTPTSSCAGHQGAAADEEEDARQRVELRIREVKMKIEEARTSPSALGAKLCAAAFERRLSEVRHLIDSGADVNYINNFGNTPLFNAVRRAHAEVVSLLLQRGADANAVDGYGESALHCAVCNHQCVELLLRAGADVDARNENGVTPLHWAANWDNGEAVRVLLAAGARRDLKPWRGQWKNKTPFDLANRPFVQDLLRG